MVENAAIQTRGFHNTVDGEGNITGFQFCLSPRYYRGLWLSQFRWGDLVVDGVEYPRDRITWEIRGVEYTPDDMLEQGCVYWLITDIATVKLKKSGGLSQGYHDIGIKFGWICNYIASDREDPEFGVNFKGYEHKKRLLLV